VLLLPRKASQILNEIFALLGKFNVEKGNVTYFINNDSWHSYFLCKISKHFANTETSVVPLKNNDNY